MEHYWKSAKKIICVLMALFMIVTPLAQAADPETPSGMTASREIIDFIEELEGYSEFQYGDSYGFSIGYGTNCEDGEYPDGISEEEAEALLLEHIEMLEEKLNAAMEKYDMVFTQYEFDALVSLTYNIGIGWLSGSRLFSLLTNGVYSEKEFINAFGVWCHVNSAVNMGLVNRRIKEINIFRYGIYQGKTDPYPDAVPVLHWIIFDENGGEVETDIQFYIKGWSYESFPEAEREGYSFTGWFTENGEMLNETSLALENLTVTAGWTENDVPSDVLPSFMETEPDNAEYDALKQVYDEISDLSDWSNPFSDVYENTWYYSYVGTLSKGGVVNGYPDGTFKPAGSLTCGEALKLILTAVGYEPTSPDDSHWASGYYNTALNNGIISFMDIASLDAKIDRLLVAKIAARAMGISASNGSSPFADTSDGYVIALYDRGIITGSDQDNQLVYLPNANLNRAEVCAIVWRMMLDKLEQLKVSTPVPNSGFLSYDSSVLTYSDYTAAYALGFSVNIFDPEPSVPVAVENPSTDGEAPAPIASPYPVILSDEYFEYQGRIYAFDDRLERSVLSGDDFFSDAEGRIYSGKAVARGIDVSSWQGKIDWEAAASDGIEFAMIRAGYRGYSEGGVYIDTCFTDNIEGALAAGLDVGVYFFSQAVNAEEAMEEALFTLSLIAGYDITYPVIFDWEPQRYESSRTNEYTTEELTECVTAFCNIIEAAGYISGYYTNRNMAYKDFDLGALADYDFWYAEYADTPSFVYSIDMWQYSSSAAVAGINGNIDINLCFKNYR